MQSGAFSDVVTSEAEVRAIVGHPSELAARKQLAALDEHCRAFIGRSPFLLLGTAGEPPVRATDVYRRIRTMSPGTTVRLRILREGQRLELPVVLGTRPKD